MASYMWNRTTERTDSSNVCTSENNLHVSSMKHLEESLEHIGFIRLDSCRCAFSIVKVYFEVTIVVYIDYIIFSRDKMDRINWTKS